MYLAPKSKLAFSLPKIKDYDIAFFCLSSADANSIKHIKGLHIICLRQSEDRFEIDSFHEGHLNSMTICINNFRKFLRNFKLAIIKDGKLSNILKNERMQYVTLEDSEVTLKQSVQLTSEIILRGNDSLVDNVVKFSIASKKSAKDYDHVCVIAGPKAAAESFLIEYRDLSDKVSTTIHLDADLESGVSLIGLSLGNSKNTGLRAIKEPLAGFDLGSKRIPMFLLCED